MKLRENRALSFLALAGVYLAAGAAGFLIYHGAGGAWWLRLLLADLGATLVTFGFSVLLGNASVYDPYWSVFPLVAFPLFCLGRPLTALNLLHLAAIALWGLRLTGNWAYTFHGLNEEDWRYRMLRERTGRLYPLVNLGGIHLVPTLIVYLCVLPAFYAARHGLDTGLPGRLFVLVSVGAALLQGIADHQMHLFRREHRGELIRSGLWTYSRHPNYLGEILMWWGIAISVFCATGQAWTLAGAVVNNALFLFVSIPMADARQAAKPGFEDYRSETHRLLPIRIGRAGRV